MKKTALLAAWLAAAALVACGSSPKVNFYSLDGDTPAGETAVASAAAGAGAPGGDRDAPYGVFIGPVSVPEAVNRPQVVLRSAQTSQVTLSEFERWAEPLKSGIARVVADNLSRDLGGVPVAAYPQHPGPDNDYRVLIDVVRFDSMLGDAVTVQARWTVRAAESEQPLRGRSYVHERVEGKNYDALVAAHSRALGAVSRDIATAIRDNGSGQLPGVSIGRKPNGG